MEVNEGIKRTAVLCILKCENQLLLLKRFKEPNKDMFTPIGGKLEPFENPNQAALRETFEETGIQLTDIQYIGSLIESSPTNYNWNSLVYISEIPFQEPPVSNEGVLHWIDIDELTTIPTPETDLHIYQYVLAKKSFMLNADYDEKLNLLVLKEEISGILLKKS